MKKLQVPKKSSKVGVQNRVFEDIPKVKLRVSFGMKKILILVALLLLPVFLISQERREVKTDTPTEFLKNWSEIDGNNNLINYYSEMSMDIELDGKMEKHHFRLKVVVYNGSIEKLTGRITHVSMKPTDIYSKANPTRLLPPPFYCYSCNFTGEPEDGDLRTATVAGQPMYMADDLDGKLLIVKKKSEGVYVPWAFFREGQLDTYKEYYVDPIVKKK